MKYDRLNLISELTHYFPPHSWLRESHTSMPFSVGDNSNPAHVAATNHHCQVSRVELDMINHPACLDVNHHGVIHLDGWVWVADGAGIMGHQVGNTLRTDADTAYFAQLVLQGTKFSL